MNKVILDSFFKNGGVLVFTSDDTFLKSIGDDQSFYKSYINTFLFLKPDGSFDMEMHRKLWENYEDVYYNDIKFSLEDIRLRIIEFKKEWLNNFPDLRFPDFHFIENRYNEFVWYTDDNTSKIVSQNIRLSPIALTEFCDIQKFIIGHELGHSYLIQKDIKPIKYSNKSNIPFIIKFYILYSTIMLSHSLIFKELDIFFTVLLSKFILFFIIYKSYSTWGSRMYNYQVEYFCDDFSFFINKKVLNIKGFFKYPFRSSLTHPTGHSRNKRLNKFKEDINDIKWERNFNQLFNFINI